MVSRVLPAAVLALSIGACTTPDPGDDDRPLVVATTTILGDVAGAIAGTEARVEVLMPVGADPHDYQPSARQAALLREADLVIVNGLGLEEGLADMLRAAEDDGVPVLEVGPALDPLPLGGGFDPHVWLDPVRMVDAVRVIAARMTAATGAPGFIADGEVYARRVLDAHEQAAALLAPHAGSSLVTNHDALGYFAARYDFAVIGVVIPGGSTLAEPSAAQLSELVEIIRSERIPAIFADTTEPHALAGAVAAEVGFPVAVVELYTGSLGPAGSGAESYLGMITVNAALVADALG